MGLIRQVNPKHGTQELRLGASQGGEHRRQQEGAPVIMKTNAKGIVAAAIAAALTAGSLAGTALANPIIKVEEAGGVTEVVKTEDGVGCVLLPPRTSPRSVTSGGTRAVRSHGATRAEAAPFCVREDRVTPCGAPCEAPPSRLALGRHAYPSASRAASKAAGPTAASPPTTATDPT